MKKPTSQEVIEKLHGNNPAAIYRFHLAEGPVVRSAIIFVGPDYLVLNEEPGRGSQRYVQISQIVSFCDITEVEGA